MNEIDYSFAIKFWQNRNKELKAELTYWKETAEFYQKELNKTLDK